MKRLIGHIRSALKIVRFGPKALAEVLHAQIRSFTEPRALLAGCGEGTYFDRRCSFKSPENVTIGNTVAIGPEARLWASPRAKLIIEDDVLVGPNVTIVTSNYDTSDRERPVFDRPWLESDVVIGRRSWLAANVVVLPGVTIGEGAVIAAGAVVASSIPPYAIAGGVPAKVLKFRQ